MKTSLAAVKDFIGLCRRVPEGFLPIVRLDVGSFKGKFAPVKKPVLSSRSSEVREDLVHEARVH